MSGDYTPSMDEVRRRFVDAYGSAYANAAFDRALAAEKAKWGAEIAAAIRAIQPPLTGGNYQIVGALEDAAEIAEGRKP